MNVVDPFIINLTVFVLAVVVGYLPAAFRVPNGAVLLAGAAAIGFLFYGLWILRRRSDAAKCNQPEAPSADRPLDLGPDEPVRFDG